MCTCGEEWSEALDDSSDSMMKGGGTFTGGGDGGGEIVDALLDAAGVGNIGV